MLVDRRTRLDTTDFSWPDDDIRGITAPTMIILGDSDGVTLEHAVQCFRLPGGGVMGDLEGYAQIPARRAPRYVARLPAEERAG